VLSELQCRLGDDVAVVHDRKNKDNGKNDRKTSAAPGTGIDEHQEIAMTDPNRTSAAFGQGSAVDAFVATQVVLRERQCRDRGWWEQMDQTFWPDSTVRLSWYDGNGPGFVLGSKAMKQRGQHTLHHVFAPSVQVRGAKAHVEVSAAILAPASIDGTAGTLTAHSRLNYRLERRNDEWRILSLDAIYEQTTLVPSVPGETITIPAEELARYRASYAILAWQLERDGHSMSADLLGDDRPEALDAFYAQMRDWLEG